MPKQHSYAEMHCRPSLSPRAQAAADMLVSCIVTRLCMEAHCCSLSERCIKVLGFTSCINTKQQSCMSGDMRRRLQPVPCILSMKPPAEVAWILIIILMLAHLQYG